VSITRPRAKLIVFVSDDILRTVPADEQVMTESMAIKGYPDHFRTPPREVDIPGADGRMVQLKVRTMPVGGPS
jgi:hypothetical protein